MMEKDAVVISDLHLGSNVCQVALLEDFLLNLPATRRLVLLGDVLESTERRLKKAHWRVLSLLRKLSDQLELVWVRGNHDPDADVLAHLIGATYVNEYQMVTKTGLKVLCVHGDVWDTFLSRYPTIVNIADWFYPQLQKWSRSIAVRAKRQSKTFQRCADKVKANALEYADSKKASAIVCGHIHQAESSPDCRYFNTGCWTDHHAHYLTIEQDQIALNQYEGGLQ